LIISRPTSSQKRPWGILSRSTWQESYAARRTDPKLLNALGNFVLRDGYTVGQFSGAGVSVVYDCEGIQVLGPVNIPSPAGPTGGLPTGTVSNGSTVDFILSNGQSARFLFVGLDGIISGWNGAADVDGLLIK